MEEKFTAEELELAIRQHAEAAKASPEEYGRFDEYPTEQYAKDMTEAYVETMRENRRVPNKT